ncbi:MAG: VWA domain-containing protein [Eubacteriales bacterium]|nr:VWA domain-containing protein [Eubacteriales bacterium]
MYGRRYQRKRGFRRTLVLLLTLVMLAGVCFPGLRASAEGETADVEVKAGEKAEYSVSGQIGDFSVFPNDGGLVCNKEDGKIVVDATSATPGTYKVAYVSGSDSDFGIEVTFTVLVLPAAEPEAQSEESEPAVTEDDETDAADPSEETTASTEETVTQETEAETEPETEEETEPETEVSFFEKLMAAESYEAIFNLMKDNADTCLELTDDQLAQLQTKANAMEDDGYQEDVLDTIAYLLNPDGLFADTYATYAEGDVNLTIAAGESGTISNSINSNSWRVVDAEGNVVSDGRDATITVGRENSKLTINATENAEPGIYTIKYKSGYGIFGEWKDAYTVQVTPYVYNSGLSGTITKGNGTVDGSNTELKEPSPSVTKTATRTGIEDDYTYDLALTVSSSVGSSESKTAVDLLFIIDKSGSMDGSNLNNAKTATNSLVDSLAANQNLDMHFAVVTFSGSKGSSGYGGTQDSAYNDAEVTCGWMETAGTVKGAVNRIAANGGTNYEAGLREGKKALLNARGGAYKYVIFLSDGAPTYHYDAKGMTDGDGRDTSNADVTHAEEMVKELVGINGFYTVFVGSSGGQTYLQKLTAAIKSVDSNVDVANATATNSSDLSKIFEDFGKKITTISCTNATVTDTLSEWVVPVANAQPYVVIKVTNSDGTVTTYSSKNGNLPEDEQDIAASLNEKVLSLNFPDDYKLKENYTYEVHLDIQPSDAAIAKGQDYPNTPDANTGTHWTDGSKKGYFSNETATLTYQVEGNNDTKSVNFPKPVVQVPLSKTTVTITKQVIGNMGDTTKAFPFVVTLTDGTMKDGTYSAAEGSVAYTVENGTKITFSLKHGENVVLKDVPVSASLTVQESGVGSYEVTINSMKYKDQSDNATSVTSNAISVDKDMTIPVVNRHEANIDTGIFTDTAPYIILFSVAAVGAAVLLTKKRRYQV